MKISIYESGDFTIKITQNFLTEIISDMTSTGYVAASAIMLSLVFSAFFSLADIFGSDPLTETLASNSPSIYLTIVHGSIVKYHLFAINPDSSLTYLAEGMLNENSSALDKRLIETRFRELYESFISIHSQSNLKLNIIMSISDNMLVQPAPYNPLVDLLQSHNISVYAGVLGNLTDSFNLSNLSHNLPRLLEFRDFLLNECSNLYDIVMDMDEQDTPENGWYILQAFHQAVRYIEGVHRIYAPLDGEDNWLTESLE